MDAVAMVFPCLSFKELMEWYRITNFTGFVRCSLLKRGRFSKSSGD
jgi:hypothetical protein